MNPFCADVNCNRDSEFRKQLFAPEDVYQGIVARAVIACKEQCPQIQQLKSLFNPRWYTFSRSKASAHMINDRLGDLNPVLYPYILHIESQIVAERERRLRQHIEDSLYFPEIKRRYDAITKAQERTFGWLFEHPPDIYSFASWLVDKELNANRIFWVEGKPGSGKSTLMRFLNDDSRLLQLAKNWTGDRKLILASCFFWSSGTHLQNSYHGLLQSLLAQLLRQYENSPPSLFQYRWDLLDLDFGYDVPWSVPELFNAIDHVAATSAQRENLLFLIDGLDEFQGSHDERQHVCNMLKQLALRQNVKICVSSRPLNIYLDIFRETPQLWLEKLTQQDIRNFVEDTFTANSNFRHRFTHSPSEANALISEVSRRASGVFLWVYLVVRSLLTGLDSVDDNRELFVRLNAIPDGLDNFFRRMLDKLDPSYRESASHMFGLAMIASHPVMTYYFMHELQTRDSGPKSVPKLSQLRALQIQNQEERRINARCMGLLECREAIWSELTEVHGVDYIHRTARDYMATAEVLEETKSWRTKPWDPFETLVQASTNLLVSCDFDRPWLPLSCRAYLLEAILSDGKVDLVTPETIFQLQNSFDVLVDEVQKSSSTLSNTLGAARAYGRNILQFANHNVWPAKTRFLIYAIEQEAFGLVLSRLSASSARDFEAEDLALLLHVAVLPASEVRLAPSLVVIRRLFELGADPNCNLSLTVCQRTAWQALLCRLQLQAGISENDYRNNVISSSDYVQITKLFLQHGAVDVVRTVKSKNVRLTHSDDVFLQVFDDETAAELVNLLNLNMAQKFRHWWKHSGVPSNVAIWTAGILLVPPGAALVLGTFPISFPILWLYYRRRQRRGRYQTPILEPMRYQDISRG